MKTWGRGEREGLGVVKKKDETLIYVFSDFRDLLLLQCCTLTHIHIHICYMRIHTHIYTSTQPLSSHTYTEWTISLTRYMQECVWRIVNKGAPPNSSEGGTSSRHSSQSSVTQTAPSGEEGENMETNKWHYMVQLSSCLYEVIKAAHLVFYLSEYIRNLVT